MLFPEWVHYIRDHEIGNLESVFKTYSEKYNTKNIKILEIGAGDGHMTSILISKGWNVIATDPKPRTPMKTYVCPMDGRNISFPDNTFDIIFSSNVLEHINDLPQAFSEMKRVLKKSGIMMHTVPTVPIVVLTFLINPIAYFRNVLLIPQGKVRFSYVNPINLIYIKGHGTSKTVFHSFFNWRKKRWKKIFFENNLKIIYTYCLNLVYSLHKTFPFMFMKIRHLIGKSWGSADIYILKNNEKL